MGVMPKDRLGKVTFCETHNPIWLVAGASIGINPADMPLLETMTADARTAYNAHISARDAAEAATAAYYSKVAEMAAFAMLQVRKIKVKAEVDGDSVYELAQIPAPAAPSPKPPPGKPFDFTATLSEFGYIEIGFKCSNPVGSQGTLYEIVRQLGPTGPFAPIATVGEKKFVDDTLPAGQSQVSYGVTAIRSTRRGEPGVYVVRFGVDESGAAITSVSEAPAGTRIAA